jgi:L-aspartate oxidase
VAGSPERGADEQAKARLELQRAMTTGAGVLRSAESLAATADVVSQIGGSIHEVGGADDAELRNLADVATALLTSARAREESRGAHTRTDHRDTEPAFRTRLVLQRPR